MLALLAALLILLSAPAARSAEPDLATLPLPELAARFEARYGGQHPVQWGPALPGTLTHLPATVAPKGGPVTVALTFDACGGGYDASIIALLRDLRVPATLFLAGPWLTAHPAEAADLARDPLFEIANHGARHRPASVSGRVAYGIRGTRSVAEFVDEVESNARRLAALTGTRPRCYRAATLFCDEVAVRVAADLGQTVTGCTVAADAGATLPAPAVARNLLAARNGDILLLHMNKPDAGSGAGLRAALPELLRRGVRFVRLSDGSEAAEAR
ncbi:polysaccharide deacetylase family protein [Nitratidesulfovibrio sp. 1201_IL3209]|uniref:polysaccharide deacetylase family protein n=1 Tax=Nitratidesulfovibrio sp. 1201_IL3209 TaxID=3084053 RepID=UPI002FD90F20